jgi:hypothetical protein
MGNGTTIVNLQMKHLSSVIEQHNQFMEESTHSRIYLNYWKEILITELK